MVSKAADILASALEHDADAQEQGQLAHLDTRIETVRREVLPINDIPRPIFKLAMRFWKEWAKASRYKWRYPGLIAESDWPTMARIIARHVRTGSLPNDKLILDNFVRRRSALPWSDLKKLFDASS